MKFIEAALKVLSELKDPITANDLWDIIDSRKLVETSGKTPNDSLNAQMILYSSNSTAKGKHKRSLFTIIENTRPYKYILYKPIDALNIESSEIQEIEDRVEKVLLYQIVDKTLDWKTLSIFNHDENIEYHLTDTTEFTYIMEDKAHDTVKIGKTTNEPEFRLNSLRTANPSIKLLHVFPSTQYSESELHQKFEDFRKDREWFFYAKKVKDFINLELQKHNDIIDSYEKRLELDKLETSMLNKFK
jgi:hypothetical protein